MTTGRSESEQRRARARRNQAARRFKPHEVKLLLVAEAPPAALDRYFYFSDVSKHDSLFRYVARGILRTEPTRADKPELLARLRDQGVFLIDLKPDPMDGSPLSVYVPALVRRIKRLAPAKIILIKASVHDAALSALVRAGQPVSRERVPFPGSGQQRRFEKAFDRALRERTSQVPG